jgi:hypothetical protein
MNHTVACAEINSQRRRKALKHRQNSPFEIMRLCAGAQSAAVRQANCRDRRTACHANHSEPMASSQLITPG